MRLAASLRFAAPAFFRALAFLTIVALLATAAPLAALAKGAPQNGWQRTLDGVTPAVVVIRVSAPRSFDYVLAGYQTATGFVVDAERGLLLTNRHVVMPGPVVAEGVFLDNEEVELQALYRDPVHDFGFYRFDPKDVKFMDLVELELAPDKAEVGVEIRVIGNDAGDKLSILAGTLARLDRAAPLYGGNSYNDFNTFYYQAASGTSGGSSGSPVVDIDGNVVAINAGGKRMAASSYYLPLNRVVRALELIRKGEPVPRGTLQTVLLHKPYDELRRLGLSSETEREVRLAFPEGTGMIVVERVVPEGPAAGLLEPGDVITRIDGVRVATFLPIEEVLDDRVGQIVPLEVERGGETIQVEVRVGDLHAISPSSFVEVGGGVLNTVSYHQAINNSVPARGVFVADSGYLLSRAGVPRGAVITEFDHQPVATLEEFMRVASAVPEGKRVTLRYFRLSNPRTSSLAVMRMSRHWFGMQLCSRDDTSGRWPCEVAPPAPSVEPIETATTRLSADGDRALKELAPSLVAVDYDIPYRLDGVHGDRFQGTGLIVDAERGLVVVDRETVPIAIGDLVLTFGRAVEIPGRLEYLHPEHNLAVISYDPTLIGDTPVKSAKLRPRELAAGDRVWMVGLSSRLHVVGRETRVARKAPLMLPLPHPPRFRETNITAIELEEATASIGGVISDKKGRVLALWVSYSQGVGKNMSSFFAGIPIERVIEMVEPLREGRPVARRSLEVELVPLSLANARSRGLTEAQASILEKHDPDERSVLSVLRLTAGSAAAELLREGDLLLAANGKPVTRFAEVERAAQNEQVRVTVLRDGAEHEIDLPTRLLPGIGTERALLWAGAVLQEPIRAISAQRGIEREGVYVARYWYGSPANRYGLRATRRILAVNGSPTKDLDAFKAAVAPVPDGTFVRLRTVDLDGRIDIISLKTSLQYWPTSELRRTPEGWQRNVLSSPDGDLATASGS